MGLFGRTAHEDSKQLDVETVTDKAKLQADCKQFVKDSNASITELLEAIDFRCLT